MKEGRSNPSPLLRPSVPRPSTLSPQIAVGNPQLPLHAANLRPEAAGVGRIAGRRAGPERAAASRR